MKVKTSELTGVALDWAVYRALGGVNESIEQWFNDRIMYSMYHYSTAWAAGGPIIERERIETVDMTTYWSAAILGTYTPYMSGDTILIAAMRCYVASKLGDFVEIPDGL